MRQEIGIFIGTTIALYRVELNMFRGVDNASTMVGIRASGGDNKWHGFTCWLRGYWRSVGCSV